MLRPLFAGASALFIAAPLAAEPVSVTATLAAHAVLPAQTFVLPPADAPLPLFMSGRFANNEREERPYAIVSDQTGLGRPFPGQPVQGFSGIRHLGDDRYLLLTDNGFGSRANSADAILMFHFGRPDWESGRLTIETTVFLSDPDRVIPYPITTEHSEARYLTGADLDPEGIQPVGDGYWIGDEFGPYLLRVDAEGRVTHFVETEPGGLLVQSPDHHRLQLQAAPDEAAPTFNLRRSRGYEGLALAADGTTLLGMLEGQLYDHESGSYETMGDRPVVRILAFDTTGGGWSPEVRYYPLEDAAHAIGDFNLIDERRALVIERDWQQGDPRLDMPEPAVFKRVYLVDLEAVDDDGVVSKLGFVDLMAIADPDGIARQGTIDGVFTFPFVTIENVDIVDDRHIVVGNDNNFPFSVGRSPGRADDNELVLLEVEELLALR
jgi:hypothetical protein